MRAPLSWINEYTPLAPGTTAEDVHAALVRVGFEEEAIHDFGITGPVVVGEVLEFSEETASNGKTIRWCQVRVASEGQRAADGGEPVHGIVCGARNFEIGDLVAVALPGAVLPGPFPISARRTYGHLSEGMIASASELGLGDDGGGILRLRELGLDAPVGTDALELLGLTDTAVEINVTPDRGYAFSLRGVAREYAHATGATFTDPAGHVPEIAASGFSVVLDDTEPIRGRSGATGFVTRVVRDVDPARPTPAWLARRLTLAGVRPISLLVDITNYVMFELGQPIHGYDLDRISGGLTVRRARAGEQLRTLDDQVRQLHPEDLLITDESGPIGLAGVMGGDSTEMGPDTRNVLIEAATFDPVSIARTARRHKLPSEASKRFERGVDPAVAVAAANRVAQLMEQLAGGRSDTLGSTLIAEPDNPAIDLPTDFVAGLIGVPYTTEQVRSSLELIGATLEESATGWKVAPPVWRPDIVDKWSLAEEVARIVGYDLIPAVLPVAPPGRGLTRAQRHRRAAANALAAAGLIEVTSYPFLSEETHARYGGKSPALRVANPLDGRAPLLRSSLLPGLVEVAARNFSRGLTDLAIFEVGLAFTPEGSYGTDRIPEGARLPSLAELDQLNAAIPRQPRRIAALFAGDRSIGGPGQKPVAAGLSDAIETAHLVARATGARLDVNQAQRTALHPGRAGVLSCAGEVVGYVGELHPDISAEAHLPRVVAVVEIDLDRLIQLVPTQREAGQLSTFPAATQDLSLVVGDRVLATDVSAAIRSGAGDLLEHIHLVDDYRGHPLPAGHKSLTFALRFRAPDRTLTAAEATEAKLAGAAVAAQRTGATIRE